MAIQFVDIAGRREFPIPGMTGYAHFSDIISYPGKRTERVNKAAILILVGKRGSPPFLN
jgi:hypothetical protein